MLYHRSRRPRTSTGWSRYGRPGDSRSRSAAGEGQPLRPRVQVPSGSCSTSRCDFALQRKDPPVDRDYYRDGDPDPGLVSPDDARAEPAARASSAYNEKLFALHFRRVHGAQTLVTRDREGSARASWNESGRRDDPQAPPRQGGRGHLPRHRATIAISTSLVEQARPTSGRATVMAQRYLPADPPGRQADPAPGRRVRSVRCCAYRLRAGETRANLHVGRQGGRGGGAEPGRRDRRMRRGR